MTKRPRDVLAKPKPFHRCDEPACLFGGTINNTLTLKEITTYEEARHEMAFNMEISDIKSTLQKEICEIINTNEKITHHQNRSKLLFNVVISNKNWPLCVFCYLHLWRVEKHGMFPSDRTVARLKSFAKASKMGDDMSKYIKQFKACKKKEDCRFENVISAKKYFDQLKIEGITPETYVWAVLPSGDKWIQGYDWLRQLIDLEAESPPNNGHQVELPRALYCKRIVFNLYKKEMTFEHPSDENNYLNYREFVVLWLKAFPNVKCKTFQAVTGKCDTCQAVYEAMQKCTCYGEFHALESAKITHRIEVTTQKASYYGNRRLAETQPETYMSIIIDGMQQKHSELPWLGNMKVYPYTVSQHLEGAKQHGFMRTIYRSFPHVKHGVNLALTCLLDQIEMRQNYCLENGKKFPMTLLLQIDGGPENTSKPFISFCQLLLKLRVFDVIEVNRLPVGHTHEDIDAMFGNLWKYFRSETVRTPQEFKNHILNAFKL